MDVSKYRRYKDTDYKFEEALEKPDVVFNIADIKYHGRDNRLFPMAVCERYCQFQPEERYIDLSSRYTLNKSNNMKWYWKGRWFNGESTKLIIKELIESCT